jgi:hypothetical protein
LRCDRLQPCSKCGNKLECKYAEPGVDTSHESGGSDYGSSERPAKRPHFPLAGAEDGLVRRPSTQTVMSGSPGTRVLAHPLVPPPPGDISARLERLETVVLGQKPVSHCHRMMGLCRKFNAQTLPSIVRA